MLGRLNAGPANNSASAGLCPIPAPTNPCTIDTSVNVAKYMNAPRNEATKFASNESPPTAMATYVDGISPS